MVQGARRHRALLRNVEAQEVFKKSEVKGRECRNCGHIVVGTAAPEVCPVYFASANATLLAFLTRLFFSTPFDETMKIGAAAAARRGGLSATFDELNKFFTISGMPVSSSQYWNSVHGRSPTKRPRTRRDCRPCGSWLGI